MFAKESRASLLYITNFTEGAFEKSVCLGCDYYHSSHTAILSEPEGKSGHVRARDCPGSQWNEEFLD